MKKFIVVGLLAVSTIANAMPIEQLIAEEKANAYENGWKAIGSTDKTALFINPKSFALDGLNRPTMWTKVITEHKGKKVVMTKALMVADCDSQKLGMSHAITYDRNRKVIDDLTVPDWQVDMHSDDPDSPMNGFVKGLCKLKADRE